MADIGGLISLAFLLGLYMLPAIIGIAREHHNKQAIFALNLLLGWTALGWIIAFVWSLTEIHPASVHGS